MIESSAIADRLRAIREARGISISELARRADLSKSSVADIEKNADRSPSISTLGALAEALGVHVATLLGVAGDGQIKAQLEELGRDAFAARAAEFGFTGVAAPEGARFFVAVSGLVLNLIRIEPGDLFVVGDAHFGRGMSPCIVKRLDLPPAFELCMFLDPYLIGHGSDGVQRIDTLASDQVEMVGVVKARLGRIA